MSRLRMYRDADPSQPYLDVTTSSSIVRELSRIGVLFERRLPRAAVKVEDLPREVEAAYAPEIAQIVREQGYQAVDVVKVTPDHRERDVLRQGFLPEHTHGEDEVRFFVAGAGLFYLHVAGDVYAVLCEAGDLLGVPAGMPHWFDMGSSPSFVALRFFGNREGWIPAFTGAEHFRRFPSFDELMQSARTTSVLLDIEGTLSPTSFVKEVLFPYARRKLPGFLREHAEDPRVRSALDAVRAEAGISAEASILTQLTAWQDADEKRWPLKQLQGLVWEEGYRDGTLVAPIYPDATGRLASWHASGVPLLVYSSGSVHAQKLFFRHSSAGDSSTWFSAHYDTTIGSKRDPSSYSAIAEQAGRAPAKFLFLSDSESELDAARAAGMRTCWVVRERPPAGATMATDGDGAHLRVDNLFDIAL